MPQPDFASVDAYIAAQPEAARGALEQVRNAIRKAVPAAEEGISYKIPAYRLPIGPVIYFAGWKQHYSLYPVTDRVISRFASELAPYDVEKGTIRFPLSERVPTKLIAGIAKLRAEELAQGGAQERGRKRAKPAAKPKVAAKKRR